MRSAYATPFLIAATFGLAGCSGGSSGKGGAAAASAAATSASATTTAGTGVSAAASVTSLLAPSAPLQQGPLDLSFSLAHPSSSAADVSVEFSVDGGQSWSAASPVASTSQLRGLATAPAPGASHSFRWDSALDVAGFLPDVRVAVEVAGGNRLEAGPFALDNQPLSAHVALNREPYLQMTTASTSIVSWRTDGASEGVVEYGETPLLGRTARSGGRAERHDVVLGGLRPDTRYYYRLVEGGKPLTRRYSFYSAPDPSHTDFSFVVVGDSGMDNPEQLAIAQLMAREQEARFFLHTGDVVYPAGALGAAVAEYNRRYFKPYAELLKRVPGFPVVGNHDLYGLYGAPFKRAFVLPSNGGGALFSELFYRFDWGDATFLALDTNTIFRVGSGPHMTWLEDQLRSANKWVIVYMHAPLYSAGKHGDSRSLQANLESLFEHEGVDLVLAGHDHDYERSKPIKQYNQDPGYAGLVHIVTGGGGAALRPVHPTPRTHLALSAHHYLKVSIAGDDLRGEAIDLNGQTIDRFTIRDQ